ncbi:unnamed protein product [Euphydryas editha]|uniref:Uncharacterized protein n=1 Tax=Euphydryas editha TaxID=104508 RepID=A0AAU9V231_EUPED|nr:unnamed protein product [Euphydryas editha]
MNREVKGKVVVVTGAANGLGLAMVTSFLDQGVRFAILLDMDEQKGKESLANLKQKFGNDRAVFYKCDVSKDLDKIFETIKNNHKHIDILVNNAGVLDEGNLKRTMDINSIAVMEWTVKFYKYMSLANGGTTHTNMADYPNAWEDSVNEFVEDLKSNYDWQDPSAIGEGTVEIFRKADSGSAWVVEGSRSAEKIKV